MSQKIDRSQINGVEVADRRQATMHTVTGEGTAPVPGIDEVMLTDTSVVYQCVETDTCDRWFETIHGAVSHLKMHRTRPSRNQMAKEAQALTAELKRVSEELESRRIAASNRAKAAAATRNARRGQKSDAADASPTSAPPAPSHTVNGHQSGAVAAIGHTLSQLELNVENLGRALAAAIGQLSEMIDDLQDIRRAVDSVPTMNADVLEKAQQFDALHAILNSKKS